nr:MAG TPA: Rhoptry kinase family protein kinase, kinase, membrane, TRANSFERASE [Caudoviricetes sp.]
MVIQKVIHKDLNPKNLLTKGFDYSAILTNYRLKMRWLSCI